MHPILFSLFGFPVKAYGFFMVLAHALGLGLIFLLARRRRLATAPLIDLFFLSIVTGLLGARALYVLAHWGEFSGNWALLFSLDKGGLSLFGGFIPAFFTAVLTLRWKKLEVLDYADALCAALPFSIALIRLGCFAQGCCYGAPLTAPWAVTYQGGLTKVPPALHGVPLHPSQLYDFFFLMALAGLVAYLARKRRETPGLVGTFTVFAYCVFRFTMDFHRGDLERGLFGVQWLSLSQLLALAGILASPVVAWVCFRVRRISPSAGPVDQSFG